MLEMVIYSLRLFVVGYYHGDGSGGAHLYTSYHGRTHTLY